MIMALLFLILSAILFPKVLKVLLALMFIGGIMILGEVHAKPDLVSFWYSLNEICRDGSGDNDRACNQIAVVEEMLKDEGCKFRNHKKWICPKG